MSEKETDGQKATQEEREALEQLGIPAKIQDGIKTLVTSSTEAMERYDVAARAAADKVEREGASHPECNQLLSALYMHAETVDFRKNFVSSSTGVPALDEVLKKGVGEDGLEAKNLKNETSGPVSSCLAKALLPRR